MNRRPRTALAALVAAAALVATSVVVPASPLGAQDGGTATEAPTDVATDEVPPAAPGPAITGDATPTPVLSARRVPRLVQSAHAAAALDAVVEEVIAPAADTTCLVVTDNGRTLVEHNPMLPLAPASNQKLPTALAALERLGPDHRFATELRAVAEPRGGVINGDLWLVGGGDSLLSTPGFRVSLLGEPQRVVSEFGELADALAAAGVREVRGDVVGDDSRYDAERYLPSWPDRYQRQDTVGPLSALRVNEGSTGLTERPDDPAIERLPGDPPLLAAETLLTYLDDRGIEVTGEARTGVAPAGTTVVAALEAPSLDEVFDEVLGWSRNAAAELLLKELGVAVGGRGTTSEGLAVVQEILVGHGLPLEGVHMVDGSGLDETNQMTCRFLVDLLAITEDQPLIADSLSVAGVNGTLTQRMVGSPAEGRVRAKTGTLNLVLSLAGYVDTLEGRTLTFAFIVNIPPEGAPEATTLQQDRLMEALVAYPEAPPVELLGP
ncbi:MAG: D-alanyl-D-alanine carboxypeptidase/D-alanyl-D-alanine-endopeptidase [Acidimicrobiia bacterium]|nr:D-alanyl-D-alanine carboxypeptidase/D-alanyl-D-alanine-endopeptidase [Acidimicrobiia bacterium]